APPPPSAGRGAPPARRRSPSPLPPQTLGVVKVLPAQPLGAAEDVVLRHIGRVAARRRLTPQRLGKGADMVRPGAAADAEIVDAERVGRLAELGDLEAVAGKGVERDRERVVARDAAAMLVAQ